MRTVLAAAFYATWLSGAVALAKDLPNRDEFLDSPARVGLPAAAQSSVSARVAHVEDRLGIPTFVWLAREPYNGVPLRALGVTPAAAARRYLADHAALYRQSPGRLGEVKATQVHDTGTGAVIVKFQTQVDGVPLFRDSLQVVMTHELEGIALTGYLSPFAVEAHPRKRLTFSESSPVAITRAFADLTGGRLSPSDLVDTGRVEGEYRYYALAGLRAEQSPLLVRPARVRKVAFGLTKGVEPAYYVELNVGAADSTDSDYYSYVVSARDGRILYRKNLTEYAVPFTYRVWADTTGEFTPWDGPQGTAASPHPTGLPDGYQAPYLQPNLVTLANGPIPTMDPWLADTATETVGNNADAYADVLAPNGFNAGDVRANTTAAQTFDRTLSLTTSPSSSDDQRKAAVTELFFLINWFHDWYYSRGFNEASGNAQTNNFGRGGLGNDPINAEGQDYSGRNNANMSTPEDGERPQMQQYLWTDPVGIIKVTVLTPPNIAGDYVVGTAAFGATSFNISADVALADDGVAGAAVPPSTVVGAANDGCETPFVNAAATAGKVVLIDRGYCSFAIKAKNAQTNGAIGVIILNNAAGAPGMSGADPTITIPVLSLSQADGVKLKAELVNGLRVTMLNNSIDKDSTVDAAIVAHEWGHYISNRLVGNANGLSNIQGRGMGEGWGDFHAMLMMVRAGDALLPDPTKPAFSGVYSTSAFVVSGGASGGSNQSYYDGIRRYPYSVDFTKNPLTFKYIANGVALPTSPAPSFGASGSNNAEVHNTGEIWANMLWEAYVGLLRSSPRLTFTAAQDRMIRYLIAGYKATPNAPTFLEARDAVLAAAYASDPQDLIVMHQAFARRGAGLRAKAPDRAAAGNLTPVESFTSGNDLEFVKAELNDGALYCDNDGWLDNDEVGNLKITLRNVGTGALSATTAVISSSVTGLTYPNGATVTFPASVPYGTTVATVQVKLAGLTGPTDLPVTIKFTDTGLAIAGDITASATYLANFDDVANSATDTVEAPTQASTSTFDATLSGTELWRRQELTPTDHNWLGPDPTSPADTYLTTPNLIVAATGNFTVDFKHRFDFEVGAGPTCAGAGNVNYDGAVIELTQDNGATWTDIGTSLYGGTIFLPPPACNDPGTNPLKGRSGIVGKSAGYPAYVNASLNLGTTYAGKTVKVRFRIGADDASGNKGWELDDIAFGGITNTPFHSVITDPGGCINRPPIANAGPAQTVQERSVVTLDGTGTVDPDNNPVTYAWTQVSGPTVTLSSATVAKPTFTAPEVTVEAKVKFQLVASDGTLPSVNSATVEITIQNVNRAPTAVAGAALSVDERTMGSLAGMAMDLDADPLTYQWTQVNGPTLMLSSSTVLAPTFLAPNVVADTVVKMRLVASDGTLSSAPSEVDVTIKNINRAPTAAVAMSTLTVAEGAPVTLTATGEDPDGDTLSFAWVQGSGPNAVLTGANTATVTFNAPRVSADSTMTLVVRASDGKLSSADQTVTITITNGANTRPVAVAGGPSTGKNAEEVTLDGTGSSDADGDALTYTWTQVAGPTVMLTEGNTASPSFTPRVTADSDITFELVVNDGEEASEPSRTTVRITKAGSGCGCATASDAMPLSVTMLLLGLALFGRRRRT